MDILKYVLITFYVIICIVLVTIVMMQADKDKGASATITGGASGSFFDKNKSRTKEGKLRRWTIILGIVFAISTIGLGIVYVM